MRPLDIPGLPAPRREALADLDRELSARLGDALSALLVYGSVATGAYRDDHSDVDLAIVLTKATRERLEAIAQPVQLARYAARIESIVLVADEIRRATDVFPLFYADMKRHHLLLRGTDPFAGLEVASAHVRLRVEQELREDLTRLRRVLIDALGDERALAGGVLRKVKQARFPLHALLGLKNVAGPDTLEGVLAAAAAAWKLDTAPILRAQEAPGPAYDALVALLERAVDDADRLEVP